MKKTHLYIATVVVLALLSSAVIDWTAIGARFAMAVNQAAAEELTSSHSAEFGSYIFVRYGQKQPESIVSFRNLLDSSVTDFHGATD